MYFEDTNILFPQSTITFGNNPFTIDWWEYPTVVWAGTRFCSLYTTGSSYGGFQLAYAGTQVYASSKYNTWDLIQGASMLSIIPGQWTHWAVVRDGNTLSSYQNGTFYGSVNLSQAPLQDSVFKMCLGQYRARDTDSWIGYIEEFRISDVARWTSNFTPPTKPYI